MTLSFSKWIDGYRFDLVSDSWSIREPFIMVPASVAEVLDEKTIGAYVKSLIDDAWFAKALSMAEMFCQYKSLTWRMLEEFEDEAALVERFAGRDANIDKAMVLIDEARTKARHRQASPQKRRDIQANYSRLFVAVGRRDGFCCAQCRNSTSDLQIDHKIAVINGGGNEMDNLQLLCRNCNILKSDK